MVIISITMAAIIGKVKKFNQMLLNRCAVKTPES